MTYLAVDPGGTTGWAKWDSEGNFLGFGEIKGANEFLDWLEQEKFDVLILEIYRNRPGDKNKHNIWSTGPTQQTIGAIKRVAHKNKAVVVEQEASPCLAIGLRFLGLSNTYKGKHVPDKISAMAHGTYFLRKKGIVKPS